MDRRIADRVEEWDARPLEGGFDGIRPLLDQGFSGAVSAGGAWLFLLNGRGVGVVDGSVDAFDGATGTIYEAPDPALPLLFTMQSVDGETYATYYTNDTPLAEVDDTLSDASFTGYIELSENVLSGDYFVVYYGGRSMSAAFVGSSERLITGDEAFEKACGEVGIYEVTKVDLDLVEIPEPDTPSAADEPSIDLDAAGDAPIEDAESGPTDPTEETVDVATGTAAESSTQAATATEATPTDPEVADSGSSEEVSEARSDVSGPDPADPDRQDTSEESPPDASDSVEEVGADTSPSTSPNDASDQPDKPTEASQERASTGRSEDGQPSGTSTASNQSTSDARSPADEPTGPESGTDQGEGDPFSEEAQWRESRTVPALNPEESSPSTTETADAESDQPGTDRQSEPATRETTGASAGAKSSPGEPAHDDRIAELRSALEEAEAEMEALRNQYEDASEERDVLREERDRLTQRIEQLENERDAARNAAGSGDNRGTGMTAMSSADALDQTDLFVRYGSKGKATLETAHGGATGPEEVIENLRLEHHTRFEESDVSVDGKPFSQYLEGTIEYRFVEWLVEQLLFEIGETKSQGKLRELYDALPAIDRVEFDGAVTSRNESGEEERRSFDVVVRDRMGQPLIIANINDGRDPATGEMMEALVDAATTVAEGHDTLAAAFLVTASFFKPEALETATEATGSGLLSREKRASFVKLSRKQGYHLCLVETRGDDFHVTVPEL